MITCVRQETKRNETDQDERRQKENPFPEYQQKERETERGDNWLYRIYAATKESDIKGHPSDVSRVSVLKPNEHIFFVPGGERLLKIAQGGMGEGCIFLYVVI